MNDNHFNILRKIHNKSYLSQRILAKELGWSLGKVNYCLNELKKKGLIKINNFKKNPKKTNYLYFLTAKGIAEKTKLTIKFMKRKMQEYDELQKDLNNKNFKIDK
ncbi:MAG: MarR family EPS-associated transcriptional regulator [Pelagibacteraceae bacterium]|jgi:MarR family transcriptional regulator, temperature-dependent positive regulator of motility|nr:MarR family EPS-associated transcriptional regulator [Pelagibacteraceae bacterium]